MFSKSLLARNNLKFKYTLKTIFECLGEIRDPRTETGRPRTNSERSVPTSGGPWILGRDGFQENKSLDFCSNFCVKNTFCIYLLYHHRICCFEQLLNTEMEVISRDPNVLSSYSRSVTLTQIDCEHELNTPPR